MNPAVQHLPLSAIVYGRIQEMIGVVCAAVLARVESSSNIGNKTEPIVTEYSDELFSSNADAGSSLVAQLTPRAINKTTTEEERFAGPISSWFGNAVRGLYSKTADPAGLVERAFAWLVSTLHLRSWAIMGRDPSDLANFLKLPKGHALFESWELRLLERYIDLQPGEKQAKTTLLLDALLGQYSNEAELVSVLITSATHNHDLKAQELLDALIAKSVTAAKSFDEMVDRFGIDAKPAMALYKLAQSPQNGLHLKALLSALYAKWRVAGEKTKYTLLDLVVANFGDEVEFERVLVDFAFDNMYRRTSNALLEALITKRQRAGKPLLNISKDTRLFASRKLDLLQRYLLFLRPEGETEMTLLDAVVGSWGSPAGEAELAPIVFQSVSASDKPTLAEHLFLGLLRKCVADEKRMEDVLALFKIEELGAGIFVHRRMTWLQKLKGIYEEESVVKNEKTLSQLLIEEFAGEEGKLAIMAMKAANDVEADQLQAKLVLCDLFETEKNSPGYLERVLSQEKFAAEDTAAIRKTYLKGKWQVK
uniref:Uncharacterized protein n=1 Tax=Peronospora matthiolae TaxID=2874970 RepID=A0AAV1URY3_9STRA